MLHDCQLTGAEKLFVKYTVILDHWLWPTEKKRPEASDPLSEAAQRYAPGGELSKMSGLPPSESQTKPHGNGHSTREGNGESQFTSRQTMATLNPHFLLSLKGKPAERPFPIIPESEASAEGAIAVVEGVVGIFSKLAIFPQRFLL